MEIKNKLVIIGDYTWDEMRDLIIVELKNCQNEQEFAKVIGNLVVSIGNKNDIIKIRKKLGIHPLTKEEFKKINGRENDKKKKI